MKSKIRELKKLMSHLRFANECDILRTFFYLLVAVVQCDVIDAVERNDII